MWYLVNFRGAYPWVSLGVSVACSAVAMEVGGWDAYFGQGRTERSVLLYYLRA
jgi:hypothetical protein